MSTSSRQPRNPITSKTRLFSNIRRDCSRTTWIFKYHCFMLGILKRIQKFIDSRDSIESTVLMNKETLPCSYFFLKDKLTRLIDLISTRKEEKSFQASLILDFSSKETWDTKCWFSRFLWTIIMGDVFKESLFFKHWLCVHLKYLLEILIYFMQWSLKGQRLFTSLNLLKSRIISRFLRCF